MGSLLLDVLLLDGLPLESLCGFKDSFELLLLLLCGPLGLVGMLALLLLLMQLLLVHLAISAKNLIQPRS